MQSYVYNFFKAFDKYPIFKMFIYKSFVYAQIRDGSLKLKKRASVLFEEKLTFSGKCTKAVEHVKLYDEMKKLNIS